MARPRKALPAPSDVAVLRHLLSLQPFAVAAWADELRRKVEHYVTAWGISNFTLHDREHSVQIVVINRTIVTVLPKRRWRRGRP